MFQLRGLGATEMDCAANPNDPVCREFYGTAPSPMIGANRVIAAIAAGALTNYNANNAQGAATAGSNVVISPPPASPLATSAGGLATLFSMIPWWVKLGALFGGGYLAYKHWYKKA